MNAPKTAPIILNERDDAAIDKLLDDTTYGPGYLVSVDVSRKTGNTTPRLRTGIQCPLVRVKSLATAMCELVAGGGQFKIDVYYDVGGGNKKRLLQPWWESFTDPARIGKPWEDLTLFWDETGGEGSDGAWTAVQRNGTGRTTIADHAPPPGGYGFGAVPAGQSDWTPPVRGLGGVVMPPPPHMQRLLPPSFRNYPPDQQWQILAANYEQQTGRRASLEPVDIVQQWRTETRGELGDVRADKARLEERHDSLRETSRREVEQANRKVAELERSIAELKAQNERAMERAEAKAREEKRDAEMAALKEKIAEKREAAAPAAAKSGIAAIDPTIIVAAIGAWQASQQAAADRQMQMMMALMKREPPPPSAFEQMLPLVTALVPAVGPIVAQYMSNKDPAKIEELESERAVRQMQLAQMLMDQVHRMVPQDEALPVWYQPVMAVINGMMGTLQTAAISAGANRLPQLPNGPQQQVQQTVVTQQPVQQAPQQRVVEARVEQAEPDQAPIDPHPPNLEALIDELAKVDPNAANITRLVMRTVSQRGIDARLLTPEWTTIVWNVHHRPSGLSEEQEEDRVANLVDGIVTHLEHCRDYRLLPAPVANVFEKPESLSEFLTLMPIYMMDQEYAKMLLESIVEEIKDRERERLEPVDPGNEIDDDESGETELEEEDEPEEPAKGAGR